MAKSIATENQRMILVDHTEWEGESVVELDIAVDLQALY
jgi:hypothetical protein